MNHTAMNPVVLLARALYNILYIHQQHRYALYHAFGYSMVLSVVFLFRVAGCLSIAAMIRSRGTATPIEMGIMIAFALLIPAAQLLNHDLQNAFCRHRR